MLRCWNCGKLTGVHGRPARSDDCPHCRCDLRCCRGCRFHDPAAPSECLEPKAEVPADKEKANFCDFFVAAEIPEQKTNGSAPKQGRLGEARSALDKLFGKG
ncbi:MAG: hypothetical protein D6679_11445 [Candidatus Hydrogenedentota bacterium]|nr:MAG: hypothetical protein D6679_11445 [Candidatus Hydrogenedentota bacterium]